MKRFWRENSLSVAVFTLFVVFMLGQTLAGFEVYNENRSEHGERKLALAEYLHSGAVLEATM